MAWLDGRFWARHFRNVFAHQVRAFGTAVHQRLLPAFDQIESEAENIAQDYFEGVSTSSYDDSIDLAGLAEMAEDAGLDHYLGARRVRQSLLNFSAAAIYHLVEQQMLLFHRRQVLHPSEEDDIKLFDPRTVRERLREAGVDIETLPSWSRIVELELLANVVKHGDGRSAGKLRQLRPDLLTNLTFRGQSGMMGSPSRYIQLPLAGTSVYVTPDDFSQLAKSAEQFWLEFADAIDPDVR